MRGLGKSSKAGGKDYSLDAMADDLAAVVERAGGRVFLCGHSIGGMIIQTFARRHALLYGTSDAESNSPAERSRAALR